MVALTDAAMSQVQETKGKAPNQNRILCQLIAKTPRDFIDDSDGRVFDS
jgi:hypothetical protein